MKGAQEWLAAARMMDGGEDLDFYVNFPVVVNATGQIDLVFVVTAPTFKEWGKFWDAYPDSKAAELEGDIVICPDSVLWESTAVEPKLKTKSSAHKARQMWRCELDDDATEEQVQEGAEEWLAAARTMKGGKNLEAYVYHPVVVNATGQVDLIFVLTAPTFEEWGEFWDGYPDSPAAIVEEKTNEFLVCPDSVLWEASKVE